MSSAARISALLLAAFSAPAFAENPAQTLSQPAQTERAWAIRTSIAYSDIVLNPNEHIVDKTAQQLKMLRNGTISPGAVYISGYAKGSLTYERTSTEDAFPLLTRFPDHAGGKTDLGAFADNAMLGVTFAPVKWLTGFAQVEYHENHFDSQNALQLRKAYATLGDLNVAPAYLTVGRKTINFGRFDQYAPFTHTVGNHFFHAESDGPIAELGYVADGFNASATAISAGRHLRTADTAGSGTVDNFALSADATIELHDTTSLTFGASYLHGTIYNHRLPHHPGPELDCPIRHGQQGVPTCRSRNGAWDIWAEINSERFDLQAEYTQTVDPWLATGEHLSTFTVQGRYKTAIGGHKTHFSAAYSRGNIGPFSMGGPGAPVFDALDSMTLGAEVWLSPHMTFATEYSRNNGFAPLINVRSAAKDATSDQIATGLRISF